MASRCQVGKSVITTFTASLAFFNLLIYLEAFNSGSNPKVWY